MTLRQAWKIIMQGSDSNHREGTKQRAYRRMGWKADSLFTVGEFADMVRRTYRDWKGNR